jgi:hypothetical protein
VPTSQRGSVCLAWLAAVGLRRAPRARRAGRVLRERASRSSLRSSFRSLSLSSHRRRGHAHRTSRSVQWHLARHHAHPQPRAAASLATMLPGISSVLRRERRPTSESSSPHSPQLSAVPSAPLPALPGSAGGAQLSSSSSARRAAALVASAREAQAASAASRQGNGYGDEGPMLPEEMRARERERERAVRQQIQGGSGQSAAGSSRGDRAGRESQGSDGASGPRVSGSVWLASSTMLRRARSTHRRTWSRPSRACSSRPRCCSRR